MNNPKLRFRREDGTSYPDWKKDKWDNLGEFIASGKLSKADISEEGTPCILYGELYTKYGEIAHTIYSKTNATSHIYSKADDVILPKSGETPEDISTATCVPFDNISLGGDLIVFRHNEKVIGAYLSYLISNRAKNAIASIAQGKSVVHISEKSLSNIELSYPNLEEQQKIADFLSSVDEVIAQSEAEVSNLQQQKKAAMQKFFSQEVRFKREAGTEFPDWTNKKIGQICSVSTGKSNTQDKIDKGQYPFYVRSPIIEHSDRYLFDEEAVITVGDGVGTGKVFHYINGKYNLHQRCYRMYDFKETVAKYFYYVFSNNFYKRIKSMSAKTSVDSVRMEMITDMPISIPCLEEQQKIADFLSAYDEAIGYAKQELDKWKELKKGLLQQMFV